MNHDKVAALIRVHTDRYAELEILDVYKLLHQAIFGPGHAIQNQRAAREWLERESDLLMPDVNALLVENIHPEGDVVRVHLRPYLAMKGNLNKLLDGFVQSSKSVIGESTTMSDWWSVFRELVEGGAFGSRFDAKTLALESRVRAAERWGAVQHSPRYERAYHPAYRVLSRSQAEALLKSQKIAFEPA